MKKSLLTGVFALAAALAVSPAFAQSGAQMRADMYNNTQTRGTDRTPDLNHVPENKEGLKHWLEDSKDQIDQQKKQAKEDYERRKDELKAQKKGIVKNNENMNAGEDTRDAVNTNIDTQLEKLEADYKKQAKELDAKKLELDQQYKAKEKQLNNK
jgi:hypothetical protein